MERLLGLIPIGIAGLIAWPFFLLIKYCFTIKLAEVSLGIVIACILGYSFAGLAAVLCFALLMFGIGILVVGID